MAINQAFKIAQFQLRQKSATGNSAMLSGCIDPYWYLIAWQLSSGLAQSPLVGSPAAPVLPLDKWSRKFIRRGRQQGDVGRHFSSSGWRPMRPFYGLHNRQVTCRCMPYAEYVQHLHLDRFGWPPPPFYDLESFFGQRIRVSQFGILSPVDGVSLVRIALPQGYNHSQPGVTWRCSPIPTPTWALHQREFGPGGVNWWTLLSFRKISAFGKLKKSQRFTRYQWANQRTVAFPCPCQFIRGQRSWIGSAATCRDTWSLYHQTHSLSVNYNELALAFKMIN